MDTRGFFSVSHTTPHTTQQHNATNNHHHNHHNGSRLTSVARKCDLCRYPRRVTFPMAARAPPLVSSGGSAVRRRERRLRSFWRHEQMAVQMALATVNPPLVPGGHRARRSTEPEACHQRWWDCGRLLSSRGGRRSVSSSTPWS